MKKFYLKNLHFIFFGLNIILLAIYLFISDFNYLKLAIFSLLILNVGFLIVNFFLKKEELIASQKDFYFELDKFFNLLDTPFVIYDDEMKIVYFNDAFLKLVNLEKSILTNFKLETWIVKNEQYLKLALVFFPSLVADNIKIIQADDPNIIEVNYQNTFLCSIISSKISYQQKIYKFKVILDQSKDHYYRKQSLEFLSLLAHHLRTPLTQLRWLLESIKDENNKENVDQALNILDKTLILSQTVILSNKVETDQLELNIEMNNFEELVKNCLEFFKYYLSEKNITVEIFIDEQTKNFYFDKNIMFFIIYTLIENAIDYNKEGGKITIKTEKEFGREYVKIQISDTGIGIAKEDLANIFKKYFRTKEAKEIKPTGFGLGLSLVYNLTKIHKGEISVESQKNIGTTFILTFPLAKDIYSL